MIFYNGYDGNGRKNPEKHIYTKTRKKIPRLVSLPSPRLENWRPTVFRVERNRKQAGPTLGRAGILIYRDKRNKGSGVVWVDTSRLYDFLHMNFQDLQ